MKILITGATGKLGALIVEALLNRVPAEQLVVSVRTPEKAQTLLNKGVEIRHGDFNLPETLDLTFADIDRLLIISTDGDTETRIRQHTQAVAAAERAKVKFIAYTSVVNAPDNPLFLAEVHRVTEEAISRTGIPYSFLRNNWYLENEIGTIQAVLQGAPWLTSAGSGKVGWALRQDYAEAAAVVLSGSGHENTVYELSGPPLTQDELASKLGQILGRHVSVQHVDDRTYAEIMKSAGVPEPVLPILTGIQNSIRNGDLDITSGDLAKLLGRPVTPAAEGLRTIVNQLKQA